MYGTFLKKSLVDLPLTIKIYEQLTLHVSCGVIQEQCFKTKLFKTGK